LRLGENEIGIIAVRDADLAGLFSSCVEKYAASQRWTRDLGNVALKMECQLRFPFLRGVERYQDEVLREVFGINYIQSCSDYRVLFVGRYDNLPVQTTARGYDFKQVVVEGRLEV
jgi:hypothetical protein